MRLIGVHPKFMNALSTSGSERATDQGSPHGDAAKPPARPVAAVLWMVVTGLSFVILTAIVKHMGDAVPAPQSAFIRYFLGLVFLLPIVKTLMRERVEPMVLRQFAWRGLAHTFAVMLWFYSMTRIPLAEVAAMSYLAPVYISIGAALFLGERLRMRRIFAIGIAIMGALIILRPGLRELNDGHLAMLATSACFATSFLLAKDIVGRASPQMVVAMLSITVTIGLAPFAFAVWQPVTGLQVLQLFVVAFFATFGHYTMTLAFAAAPITVTQPVTALQLVWAVTLGAVLFNEPVDAMVILGGVLIVSAVVFIAIREHQVKR